MRIDNRVQKQPSIPSKFVAYIGVRGDAYKKGV